jgi:hypothetical protein
MPDQCQPIVDRIAALQAEKRALQQDLRSAPPSVKRLSSSSSSAAAASTSDKPTLSSRRAGPRTRHLASRISACSCRAAWTR